MQPESLSVPCGQCGAPVEVIARLQNLANDYGVMCPACAASAEGQRLRLHATTWREQQFARLCPPCFQDTEPAKLPCAERSAGALAWKYGKRGLNLFGVPATGKTRTASLIVEREVKAGRSAACLAPGDFARELEARRWTPGAFVRRLSRVDLLFCDDIGTWQLYMPAERHLFAVLNARAGRLPTLFTGNQTGRELSIKFKMGEPLIRRIRDFCQHVHFGQEDITA